MDVVVESWKLARRVVRLDEQLQQLVLETRAVARRAPVEPVAEPDGPRLADLRPVAERWVAPAARRRSERQRKRSEGGHDERRDPHPAKYAEGRSTSEATAFFDESRTAGNPD
jgi:hypothetical protein